MKSAFYLRIDNAKINSENVVCTGKQFGIILKEIQSLREGLMWFVADILVPGQYVIQPYDSPYDYPQTPLKIGTTSDLLRFVETVGQFHLGIFMAVEAESVEPVQWRPTGFDTEDSRYIEPCELILRAFDTSFIEVSSPDKAIISRLGIRFQTMVETK